MKIEGLGSVKTGTEGDFDTVKPVESTTGRGTASPITAPIVTKAEKRNSPAQRIRHRRPLMP